MTGPSLSEFNQYVEYVELYQDTYVCVCACVLSHVQLFATPWSVAHQAPLSISRQENWSGLPFLSPGNLPDPEGGSPSLLCLLYCRLSRVLFIRALIPSLVNSIRLHLRTPSPWGLGFNLNLVAEDTDPQPMVVPKTTLASQIYLVAPWLQCVAVLTALISDHGYKAESAEERCPGQFLRRLSAGS